MTRLAQLPQNRIVKRLVTAKRTLDELKGYQRVGSDSSLFKRIFTANASDRTETSVGFNNKAFYVVWTPNDQTFDLGVIYKLEMKITQTGGFADVIIERQKVEAGNVQRWLVVLNGSDAFPVSSVDFKFYLWASSDDGVLSTETI